jgi:hypothetical protein
MDARCTASGCIVIACGGQQKHKGDLADRFLFIRRRHACFYFLSQITRFLSSSSATKIASSFAGFVLLAFSLSV